MSIFLFQAESDMNDLVAEYQYYEQAETDETDDEFEEEMLADD
jgi:hypothetical protein